ncbi:MAG TPA: preprotein translocase subunit YajC [Acidimicrobiales bacterium]|jgi:preprotein translocase subunit YajC|nr:preprotein translocase subunit YajC [Acidimicrobiales bacterium]
MELLPLLLLFAVMYFLLIRPQQQRVRAQRALVSSLEVGDEVVTIGGLIGRIIRLDDDSAEIETTPGTVLRFRRSAISGKLGPVAVDDDVIDVDDPTDPQPPRDQI